MKWWFQKEKQEEPMESMIVRIEKMTKDEKDKYMSGWSKEKKDKIDDDTLFLKITGVQGEIQGLVATGTGDATMGNLIKWFRNQTKEL